LYYSSFIHPSSMIVLKKIMISQTKKTYNFYARYFISSLELPSLWEDSPFVNLIEDLCQEIRPNNNLATFVGGISRRFISNGLTLKYLISIFYNIIIWPYDGSLYPICAASQSSYGNTAVLIIFCFVSYYV